MDTQISVGTRSLFFGQESSRKDLITEFFSNPRLLSLRKNDFLDWLHLAAPFLEEGLSHPNTAKITKELFASLLEARKFSEKESIPIFQSIALIESGVLKNPPEHAWVTLTSLLTNTISQALVDRESQFHQLHRERASTSLATQENIQAAFDYIKTINHLAWEYLIEGCFAKASVTAEYLLALGFEKERIFTATIKGNNVGTSRVDPPLYWMFHTAAGITLEDGSLAVIDPSLDPTAPLLLHEWEHLSKFDKQAPSIPAHLTFSLSLTPAQKIHHFMTLTQISEEVPNTPPKSTFTKTPLFLDLLEDTHVY